MTQITGIPLSLTAHAHDIYLDQAMLRVQAARGRRRAHLHAAEPRLPEEARARPARRARPPLVSRARSRRVQAGGGAAREVPHPLRRHAAAAQGLRHARRGVRHPRSARASTSSATSSATGRCAPRSKRAPRSSGSRGVNFLGKQSQEKLPEIYRSSSVFVLAAVHGDQAAGGNKKPSASDLIHFGIPNVILEAMASGVPIVTTRHAGARRGLRRRRDRRLRARARSGGARRDAQADRRRPQKLRAHRRARRSSASAPASTSRSPAARWQPRSRCRRARAATLTSTGPSALPRALRRHLSRHELAGVARDREDPASPRRAADARGGAVERRPTLDVGAPEEPASGTSVRGWQARGWTIGLHGYQHRYVTRDDGLIGINERSEFAGLPAAEQADKLRRAVEIFRAESVRPDVWIAPGHSFDAATVQALRDLGVDAISDGFFLSAHRDERDMLWVPQQMWSFRYRPLRPVDGLLPPQRLERAATLKRFAADVAAYRARITSFAEVASAPLRSEIMARHARLDGAAANVVRQAPLAQHARPRARQGAGMSSARFAARARRRCCALPLAACSSSLGQRQRRRRRCRRRRRRRRATSTSACRRSPATAASSSTPAPTRSTWRRTATTAPTAAPRRR